MIRLRQNSGCSADDFVKWRLKSRKCARTSRAVRKKNAFQGQEFKMRLPLGCCAEGIKRSRFDREADNRGVQNFFGMCRVPAMTVSANRSMKYFLGWNGENLSVYTFIGNFSESFPTSYRLFSTAGPNQKLQPVKRRGQPSAALPQCSCWNPCQPRDDAVRWRSPSKERKCRYR